MDTQAMGDVGGLGDAGAVMCLCRYEGEAHVLMLSTTSKMEELKSMVCERWIDLRRSLVSLSYEVPVEKDWVNLKKDEDVGNMVRLHNIMRVVVCKMVVKLGASTSGEPILR